MTHPPLHHLMCRTEAEMKPHPLEHQHHAADVETPEHSMHGRATIGTTTVAAPTTTKVAIPTALALTGTAA